MPMRAPRISRSTSDEAPMSSVPSKRAEPLTRAPTVRPVMVCVATLLPDPDSPTMARVAPRSTSKDSPRTASSTPSGVLKATRRSRTSRRDMVAAPGSLSAALLVGAQPDVGRVEVLDRRHVDRSLHLGRTVVCLQRVADREERRVLHDLLVGLSPQARSLVGGLRRTGLLDQRVGSRV